MNIFSGAVAWLSNGIKKAESFITKFIDMETLKHLLLVGGIVVGAYLVEFTTHGYGETKATYKMTKLLKYSVIFPDSIHIRDGDFRSVLISRRISDSMAYVT